jgi:hypothetical protein
MRSKEIEQEQTIFTVHEWEQTILWYSHFQDLTGNDRKWLRNDWEMTEKWLRNDWEMTENDWEMTEKWLRNDFVEMTEKWLRNDFKMTLKWLRNDWEMTEKWLRNDWEMNGKNHSWLLMTDITCSHLPFLNGQ